jgi:nuclease A inhibitor-like protein
MTAMRPANPASDASMTLRERLEQATVGLVYSSESDRPFEYFFLPAEGHPEPLTLASFTRRLGVAAGTPTEERTLDSFLARHTHRSDPYDARAQAMRPRYERLQKVLERSVGDVRVFRVGSIEVACYAVGQDELGNIVGLRTVAVET